MNKKILSYLSIGRKAGKIASGEFLCEKAVKAMQAKLVIVACDASDNTKKLFKDKCGYRNIPYIHFGTKVELGATIGQSPRSSIAIMDQGIADVILQLYNSLNDGGGEFVKN